MRAAMVECLDDVCLRRAGLLPDRRIDRVLKLIAGIGELQPSLASRSLVHLLVLRIDAKGIGDEDLIVGVESISGRHEERLDAVESLARLEHDIVRRTSDLGAKEVARHRPSFDALLVWARRPTS